MHFVYLSLEPQSDSCISEAYCTCLWGQRGKHREAGWELHWLCRSHGNHMFFQYTCDAETENNKSQFSILKGKNTSEQLVAKWLFVERLVSSYILMSAFLTVHHLAPSGGAQQVQSVGDGYNSNAQEKSLTSHYISVRHIYLNKQQQTTFYSTTDYAVTNYCSLLRV